MPEAVRVYIERVKAALSVTTDKELADKIGYSKQAIANWRRRDGVPQKAELRIVDLLGDEFAIGALNIVRKRVGWDDITHGLALFAVDQYTSHWSRPLSYAQARAIGWRFNEIEGRLRNLFRAHAVRSKNPDQAVGAIVRIIEERSDPGINDILSVFLKGDLPPDEFEAVPYWFLNPSA